MTLDDNSTRGMAASVSEAPVFSVGPVVKHVKDRKPVLQPSAADRLGHGDLRPESIDIQSVIAFIHLCSVFHKAI